MKKKDNSKIKEETLDERLEKMKPDLYLNGKRLKWSDVKNISVARFRIMPGITGNLPKIWQENMNREG